MDNYLGAECDKKSFEFCGLWGLQQTILMQHQNQDSPKFFFFYKAQSDNFYYVSVAKMYIYGCVHLVRLVKSTGTTHGSSVTISTDFLYQR